MQVHFGERAHFYQVTANSDEESMGLKVGEKEGKDFPFLLPHTLPTHFS